MTAMTTFVPLDKSYIIRMAVLDLLNDRTDTFDFLKAFSPLSADLRTARALGRGVRRTESATLFRFMTFASWQYDDIRLSMHKVGTLRNRVIFNDPVIINWPQEKLMTLDYGTSQWASAAAICDDPWRLPNAPEKLKLTYKAIDDWRQGTRAYGPDQTILTQMRAFDQFRQSGEMVFTALQSEDYCFARAYDVITQQEGLARWPSLRGHECDRFAGMEQAIHSARQNVTVRSDDHRVVQAIAMVYPRAQFLHPACVSKSWPLFWKFLDEYSGFQERPHS